VEKFQTGFRHDSQHWRNRLPGAFRFDDEGNQIKARCSVKLDANLETAGGASK
jgi:hypothetical protein